ncbi:DUF2264 domain-containing protein [Actinospica sp.]|uniref:DUF2264 domain-containing protein n=1 Tax=Actinospica sp. TaxID=1872142 RepID=UPI002BD548D6|nr:DUF2264 domain-containing protein [Actinospica sp.]HWG28118.1 DUF2264 domain-containing protein [Actinospica sp.]
MPHTREDFQRALLELCEPFAEADALERRLSTMTHHPAAHYAPRVARLEAVSRLLWGLAPLAAGQGEYRGWEPIRAEIAVGTDPNHPGFWGWPGEFDQRIVESAALGFALALCPQELWQPFDPAQRARFADWLRAASRARAVDNNWRLFATLVNLGLKSVGEPFDAEITTAAFRRVDEFHHGGGWYADGPGDAAFDHYNPWAIHFYGLLNAALGGCDAEAAGTVRQRARDFAPEYLRWFAADGAGLAFGRSLTYRFAQAAFFGAMAFADEPGPGWGVLRGAWARQIRSWSGQPVLNGDGTLSIGYAYPSLLMSEQYNAAGSPYWALKAFLPLALPATHPFWTHPEEPLPPEPSTIHIQPKAGFILSRGTSGHVTALSAAPGPRGIRHSEAKYRKFAYSTAFGFSVPTRLTGLAGAGIDSTLALSEEGDYWRVRTDDVERSVDGDELVARWRPWPDVEIETRLSFNDGCQLRRHRITTRRALHTVEGAFCVPLGDDAPEETVTAGSALAVSGGKASGIRDTTGVRHGAVLRPDPNGHLLWPRTLLPVLRGDLEPGEHELTTLVYANSTGDTSGYA